MADEEAAAPMAEEPASDGKMSFLDVARSKKNNGGAAKEEHHADPEEVPEPAPPAPPNNGEDAAPHDKKPAEELSGWSDLEVERELEEAVASNESDAFPSQPEPAAEEPEEPPPPVSQSKESEVAESPVLIEAKTDIPVTIRTSACGQLPVLKLKPDDADRVSPPPSQTPPLSESPTIQQQQQQQQQQQPASANASLANDTESGHLSSRSGASQAVRDSLKPAAAVPGALGHNGIQFTVASARKAIGDNKHPYWVYQIEIQTRLPLYTNQPHFASQELKSYFEDDGLTSIQCEKRYSDFEWLYSVLKAAFPYAPLPPVPEKSRADAVSKVWEFWHSKDESSDDPGKQHIVSERKLGLELFLRYLGCSPLFSTSDILRNFLLRSSAELAQYRVELATEMEADRVYFKVPALQNLSDLRGWVRSFFQHPPSRLPTNIQQAKATAYQLQVVLPDLHRSWETAMHNEAAVLAAATSSLSKNPASFPESAEPLTSVNIQIGLRVVNDDGQKGTIKWAGTLAKGPRPDMTYAGVQWDEPIGKHDGSIFGDQKFQCAPGYASFVPPEVLSVEPPDEQDPVLAALTQTVRQTEIVLSADEADRAQTQEFVKEQLRIWTGLAQSSSACIDYIDSLNLSALQHEHQGAADGRSHKLSHIRNLIDEAVTAFTKEWEHFLQQWRLTATSFVHSYVKLYKMPSHPFETALSRWIAAVPSTPTPPVPLPHSTSGSDAP
ncbi:putative phosphoinositide-binding protein [Diplonema papillatum]|nr:putative phosphoinositide-binding protein [Diplonema papillatum]